jgi:hypothetical protein
MSVVTNVMIRCYPLDPKDELTGGPAIDAINSWLEKQNDGRGAGFLQCATVDLIWGGNSAPELSLWVGSFNGLDVEEFLEVVEKAPWDRCDMQLFLQRDSDSTFGIWMFLLDDTTRIACRTESGPVDLETMSLACVFGAPL